jgi:6-phosphogluconolactonase
MPRFSRYGQDRHGLTTAAAASPHFRSSPRLGERAAFVQFEGTGPHPKRQKSRTATPSGNRRRQQIRHSCDLAQTRWIFRSTPPGRSRPPRRLAGPARQRPAALAIHPNGKIAYANNELNMTVTAFNRDTATGAFTELHSLSTLPRAR